MISGILGKKIGMTQLYDERGDVRPVTVLQAGPCIVTQKKTAGKEGYDSVQVGLVEFVKAKNMPKPMLGHFGKNNLPPMKFVKEFEVQTDGEQKPEEAVEGVKVGDKVLVDIFNDSKFVDVSGISKGRGFAGVVKRHKFGGGPKAHGHMFQVQGSIGSSSFPSRVFKGLRMPGHMGAEKVTVRNLKIRGIDLEENLLLVEGAVPGHRNAYVVINKAKNPPRERRGFAGSTTLDPLKAAKKAAAGKKK
ncbi:MAG: 50S ribosomal protein L3 [Acidobacteriales bacterium]|nr:50S ribosomal protein L3 [Terriglobales bacterium]